MLISTLIDTSVDKAQDGWVCGYNALPHRDSVRYANANTSVETQANEKGTANVRTLLQSVPIISTPSYLNTGQRHLFILILVLAAAGFIAHLAGFAL